MARLNLHALLKNGESVWVRNMSGTPGVSDKAGLIVMALVYGNATDKIMVPPGSDPVCLTDQVPSDILKTCSDLFKLVNSGALELLDPADAEQYYADNAGRRKRMEKKIAEMKQIPKATGENIEVRIDGKPVTGEHSEKKPQRRSAKTKVNECIDNICLKLQHDAISSADAIDVLEERESEFKKSDFDYLMKNSKSDAVTAWAIKHSQKG